MQTTIEEQIKSLIITTLGDAKISISGDGRHFDAVIISEQFSGKNSVKRQQLVYAALGDAISRGDVHAFSMKTYTPQEWEEMNG